MHPLIHVKKGTPVLLVALVLVCFPLLPSGQALLPPPPPDGGYPNGNTAEGTFALFNLTSGIYNTANGFNTLANNTTGSYNTAAGFKALGFNTTGNYNTANGFEALTFNTTGSYNTANGQQALFSNATGEQNTATGTFALLSNTAADNNTANGFDALLHNTTGTQNTATGAFALYSNTTANNNTADGFQALLNNSTGTQNTAVGESAFKGNTTGNDNTGLGFQVAFHNTTGPNNTAIGFHALLNNSTGSNNIALGANAGVNLTSGSNNIDIGSAGGGGKSNTTHIGSTQTRTFVKSISGAVVAGAAVVVNASGQLGVAPSSARFKDEIRPMDKESEAILALKPVSFCYDQDIDPAGAPQFGLVAEDVEKINPDLVVHDSDGKPYTVRYEAVNAMLLNEFLKEHRKVEEQRATIGRLETTVAKQERGLQAVTARLDEQAVQIQKVSAQLEASRPVPQVVNNP
jgi:trimeric autotransporter adhesin